MIRILPILLIALSGCCWLAKRDCFPVCPPQLAVEVEQPCKLPPVLKLPAVRRTVGVGCPEKLICFDIANSGKLAAREAAMKDWIRSVRKRCGRQLPTTQPTSQPLR